jgi:LemA protein
VRLARLVVLLGLAGGGLPGCGSGQLQAQEEAVRVEWSEAVNLYQRRSDLVPEVLAKLRARGFEDHDALSRAEMARAATLADPPAPALLDDADAFARSQAAQVELREALATLLHSADQQPALSSDAGYRDLRSQLQDVERRITQVRLRYAEASHAFNTAIRRFPDRFTAGLFDHAPMPGMARVDAGGGKVAGAPKDPGRPMASH